MVTKITGKNIQITEGMREKVEEKLSFLDKFLRDIDRVSVTVSKRKNQIKIAAVVSYDGKIVKVEREVTDFYAGLDMITEKLKNTILRQHEFKVKQKKVCEKMFEEMEEMDIPESIPEKTVEMVGMSKTEAMEHMETYGYDFFLFCNTEKGNCPSVLYRRHDGTYGILNGK